LTHPQLRSTKEIVLLRITGAFSFKEIGEVFNKNENWARVTFYRAKQKIMKGRL
jgi:RNA polymerase sigma-70 factor (ECF subfamily)